MKDWEKKGEDVSIDCVLVGVFRSRVALFDERQRATTWDQDGTSLPRRGSTEHSTELITHGFFTH